MKVHYFICAALLCAAPWGHCGTLSKQDIQNVATIGNPKQKLSTDNLDIKVDTVSGTSSVQSKSIFPERQTQPDAGIYTASFQDSNPFKTIGKAIVQPAETRSSQSSPEPGTLLLLGTGMAGMIFITRQRIKRKTSRI